MDEAARRLIESLVNVYAPYVRDRLAGSGLEAPPDLDEALGAGRLWLEDELTEVLQLPAADQRRGPLEIFQEAMRFPTEALVRAGFPPVRRDPAAERALPGDLFDLAPASSVVLGEDVWRAHLAWGAGKAAALTNPARRPGVGLLSGNLMDRSRIESTARAAGLDVVVWVSIADLVESTESVMRAFVDLAHPDADQALRVLAGRGVRTVAYGPHVDDIALARARALGAADAMPRSRFFRRLASDLPVIA